MLSTISWFMLILGFALGYLLMYLRVNTGNKNQAQLQSKLELVQQDSQRMQAALKTTIAERDAAREEATRYRAGVDTHFATTSELFRDVTERYKQLYDHLSDGAAQLTNLPVQHLEFPAGNLIARVEDRSESQPEQQSEKQPEKQPEQQSEKQPEKQTEKQPEKQPEKTDTASDSTA